MESATPNCDSDRWIKHTDKSKITRASYTAALKQFLWAEMNGKYPSPIDIWCSCTVRKDDQLCFQWGGKTSLK